MKRAVPAANSFMSYFNFSWLWGEGGGETATVAQAAAPPAVASLHHRHHAGHGQQVPGGGWPGTLEPSPELRFNMRLEAERQELFKLIDYDPTQVRL